MRVRLKALFLFSAGVLLVSISSSSHGQISLPGFGQKNPGSNDQKANALLHQHLPLDLDANSAYPTVPNEDLLGGPFRGRVLPITLDTLTKPLPPGDYVLPMTFFCSEYSIHRPGAGTAYVLAPAKGTAAKAISTLLWRGMLTGHKPQELQSVSWAIQGSVAYDKMPANYKRLVDELIPDMKNQVNGQAFADIEDGFQGKVNRATKKISDAIGKGTGGHVHADIKVDVELNESFQRLGRLGKMALDGESINSIVTAANLTDSQREQALYAGQGSQSPPLPAANGPWSVIVPGVAYMRFVVHGGNLQSDNVMQIRISKPGNSSAALGTRPHLVLAQYPQSTPTAPSLVGLVNGTVNQAALSQCLATSSPQNMCVAGSINVGGLAAFAVGTGAQSPLLTAANPLTPPVAAPTHQVCVKKVLYEPTELPDGHIGLCIYLAAMKNVNNSCNGSQVVDVADDQSLNWVQTFEASQDEGCTASNPHKDPCTKNPDRKLYGPLYRPDQDQSPGGNSKIYTSGDGFNQWKQKLNPLGDLQLIFRDVPNRGIPGGAPAACGHGLKLDDPQCSFKFATVQDAPDSPTLYADPAPPAGFQPSGLPIDNNLRLVRYPSADSDPYHFGYTPLIQIRYGFTVDVVKQTVTVSPLYIGSFSYSDNATSVVTDSGTPENDEIMADGGGTISISKLTTLSKLSRFSSLTPNRLPTACTAPEQGILAGPPPTVAPFPYNRP